MVFRICLQRQALFLAALVPALVLLCHQSAIAGRRLALTIGINRYEDLQGTGDLRYAEADAVAFGELMRSQYGYEVIEPICTGGPIVAAKLATAEINTSAVTNRASRTRREYLAKAVD